MDCGDERESSEIGCGAAGDGLAGGVFMTASLHKDQDGNGHQRLSEGSIADVIGCRERGNRHDGVWLRASMTRLMREVFEMSIPKGETQPSMTGRQGQLHLWRARWFGERDAVADQLAHIARQGSGMARLAHICASLMLVLFSAGSLVALGGDALLSVLDGAQQGQVDLPAAISLGVSTLLVLCMDVAISTPPRCSGSWACDEQSPGRCGCIVG
jgi:hypothetical protein